MSSNAMRISLTLLSLALALATVTPVQAATVVINNINAPGVGFNDPAAPAAAAGCNIGETIGACRLRVFNQAAVQWGALLISDVTITINGQMTALTCSGTSAVLGSAGPTTAFSNFPNAPRPNTAYVQALANSLAGVDQSAQNDLNANFNVDIDNGTCLNSTAGWWYNTDPLVPVPADRTPLLPVVFHEIAHGIGFVSLYSNSDGSPATGAVTPAWGYYLFDTATMKLWKDMSNAERVASTINDPNLVWTGPLTNKWSPKLLGPPAAILISFPAEIVGTYNAQTAEFGANVGTNPVTGNVALVNDGTGALTDGCETPYANAAAVAGKIALIDRGTCTFTIKVKNAQLNGAIGAIIANNVATGLPGMGGSDDTITIPSLGSTQALGTSIKSSLAGSAVTATLGTNAAAGLAGTNSGCVRMNGPNPVVGGSSVSHFTPDTFPNLLMEPALNRSIFNKVDLTLPLFRDIGWKTNPENILFLDGFDSNPCQFVQP